MAVSATLYILSKQPSQGVVNSELLKTILRTLSEATGSDCKVDAACGLRSTENWQLEFKYKGKKLTTASVCFYTSDMPDLAEGKNIGIVSIDRLSIEDKSYITPFRDLVKTLMVDHIVHWQDSDHGDDPTLVTPEWLKQRFKTKR